MSARTKQALSVAGVVVLGPVAAVFVLAVIPGVFGIEWFCLFEDSTKAADRYATSAAIATGVSWLALVVGTIAAHKGGRPDVGTALPLVWFALIIAASIVAASEVGSQPCHGGIFD